MTEKPPSSMARYAIWYVLALILLLSIFQYYSAMQQSVEISYSEFRHLVQLKGVDDLTVSTDAITGNLLPKGIDELAKERKKPDLPQTLEKQFDKKKPIFSTVRLEDPDLVKLLAKDNINYRAVQEKTWLTSLLSWVFPFLLLIGIWVYFFRKIGSGAGGLMTVGKSKAKVYVQDETKVTFQDVAGVEEAEEELKEIIEFLKNPAKFQVLGGNLPKGVLLVGPPGTGKTLLARAVAGEAGVPFMSLSGSDFVEMFVGVGAARVRDLFATAQEKAPCIIFIDELDAIGKARGLSPHGGPGRTGKYPEPAVVRDGRLRHPQRGDHHGRHQPSGDPGPGPDPPRALRPPHPGGSALPQGPGRYFADPYPEHQDLPGGRPPHPGGPHPRHGGVGFGQHRQRSGLAGGPEEQASVEMDDFEAAIDRVVAGLEKRNRVMNPKEKEIVAYHETGHALVAEALPTTDRVHRVSIIPRGIGALGYTMQLPTEDRYLMTKTELEDRMAVMMGGRVAEELTFNEISTGAQNDLYRATDVARSMVREYGMSERLGPITFERERRPLFLDTMMPPGSKDYSEATALEIDQEVAALVERAHQRAREVLEKEREVLSKAAKILLEKEVLEGEELREILNSHTPDAAT